MKNLRLPLFLSAFVFIILSACGTSDSQEQASSEKSQPLSTVGQSGVQDADSKPNVVQIAVGSADHTTLVAALQAADYVDALTNVGPFTVFAPTNAAFDALPEGTLETLTKPENKRTLRDILEYHVLIGVYPTANLTNGRKIGTADSRSIEVKISEDGTVLINDAKIIATVEASNGLIHVIDQVLQP